MARNLSVELGESNTSCAVHKRPKVSHCDHDAAWSLKRNKVGGSVMDMAAGTSQPPNDTMDFHFNLVFTLDDHTTKEGTAEPRQPQEDQ